MLTSYIYDAVRTPFGRYGKGLAGVRPDDLAAVVTRASAPTRPSTNQSTGAVAHARAVTPRSRTGRSLSPDDRRSTPRWPPSRSQPLTPAVHQICRPPAGAPGQA